MKGGVGQWGVRENQALVDRLRPLYKAVLPGAMSKPS
jgi:hypothetical protein